MSVGTECLQVKEGLRRWHGLHSLVASASREQIRSFAQCGTPAHRPSDWCAHTRPAAAAQTRHPCGEEVRAPGPGLALSIPTSSSDACAGPHPKSYPDPGCMYECFSLHP
jgi:hypothetical protein